MVEGYKLLEVALDAAIAVESVYVDPGLIGPEDQVSELLDRCLRAGSRVFELDAGVLARVADTVSPQPILAVVGCTDWSLVQLGESRPDLVVVCVDVRDPGNAGTVLRSAEAAGAGGVIFCDGSVDVFNPKTVRASAGAIFHVPVVASGDAADVLDALGRWGVRRLGTSARAALSYTDADLVAPVALVLGNEAHGLPTGLERRLDGEVSIPMAGRAESLNVGMAAAVICFEASRQRGVRGRGRAPRAPDPAPMTRSMTP